MFATLASFLISAALVLGVTAVASPGTLVSHSFALLGCGVALTLVIYFRYSVVRCMSFMLPAHPRVRLTVGPVLRFSAFGTLLGIIVLAYLISRDTSTYLDEFKRYCCAIPFLPSLLWHCNTTETQLRKVPSPSGAATPADDPSRCATYDWASFSAGQPPNLALSLPLSSHIAAEMTLLHPVHTISSLDGLASKLCDVVSELRELAHLAGGIIAFADETHERWKIRFEAQAGRTTPRIAYCNLLSWLFDPYYLCREHTLPKNYYEGLKQSFDTLHSKADAAATLAAGHHAALFSLHELLSEVSLAAPEDRMGVMRTLRRAWAPGARRERVQLLETAQTVQSYSTGLRCSIHVAAGAVKGLIGSLKALADATSAPPAELNEILKSLGALADGNAATLKAMWQLNEVLGGS